MTRPGLWTRIARHAAWLPVASLLGLSACAGFVVADGGYYDGDVPPEYVATMDPVYYNGVPCYWYGGHWMYRDAGGHWAYFAHEPAYLAQHRAAGSRAHYYGNAGYRGGAHPAGGFHGGAFHGGGARGGGGHGGGHGGHR